MQPSILITNGGAHPAAAWAAATAGMIFPLDGVEDPARKVQAMVVQSRIAVVLEACHKEIEDHECGHLHQHGSARLADDHDVGDHVEDALRQVHEATAGSPWDGHFQKLEVATVVRQIIGDHFATNQHVHRLHHCDANPDCPVAQKYRVRFQG